MTAQDTWRQARSWQSETHTAFRDQVRRFLASEMEVHGKRWENDGVAERGYWTRAAELGMLAPQVPEKYGGSGLDISYGLVVSEEIAYALAPNTLQTHSDVVVDYVLHFANENLKHRWLPGSCDGSAIGAIAMTEPGAGSDLHSLRTKARRAEEKWIVNGSKTYISNGQLCDYVVTATKTDGSKGLSLLLIPSNAVGLTRGRNLDKIGQHSGDTSELFYENVEVPLDHLLGEEGKGLSIMVGQLPQERLSIAAASQAGAQRAYDEALAFVRNRRAFGRTVLEFQNTQFELAEMKSLLQVGWAHLDWAIQRHLVGGLTPEEAAVAKLWHTEAHWKIVDAALQLHGGAGYMNEYPIARAWRDARVQRIFGGTSEIMKQVIGKRL